MDERRAAILTIQTEGGGIPSMVNAIHQMLAGWGYNVTVYRAEPQSPALSRLRRLAASLSQRPPAETLDYGGARTLLVPAPPFPFWMYYLVPHFLTGLLPGQHEIIIAVSGSAHVALPLALRGTPYVMWVATPYEDELQAKVVSGDEWAQRVMSGPGWRILQAQERIALRGARQVLALSPYTARRLKEIAPGAANRLDIMLYPIDTGLFRPDPAVQANPPYGRYLVFTARINDPRKNIPMLLRAFAIVRGRHPDMKLVLAGEQPNDAIKSLTRDLGLSDAVIYPGPIPARSPELIRLYQGAQLFVLPSVQEGLGISMLEAIACGTPVVATPCGGPEGIVVEGQTGRMVSDLHDPAIFADAACDLLDHPDELALLRERCVQYAAEHFSRPVVADQFRQACDAARAPAAEPRRLRTWLAAGWAVFIFGMYMVRQISLRWPAIQARLIDPLFNHFP